MGGRPREAPRSQCRHNQTNLARARSWVITADAPGKNGPGQTVAGGMAFSDMAEETEHRLNRFESPFLPPLRG
jgi:hypothetical protein